MNVYIEILILMFILLIEYYRDNNYDYDYTNFSIGNILPYGNLSIPLIYFLFIKREE